MTAMMTFFLVMWLVNSASKEKIIQLASYFNPVKLSDRTPSSKGVREPEERPGGRESAQGAAEKVRERRAKKRVRRKATKDSAQGERQASAKSSTSARHADEEKLFRNPFGVLTQLASQAEEAMAAGPRLKQARTSLPLVVHPTILSSPIP